MKAKKKERQVMQHPRMTNVFEGRNTKQSNELSESSTNERSGSADQLVGPPTRTTRWSADPDRSLVDDSDNSLVDDPD